jgi:hypothetical protein
MNLTYKQFNTLNAENLATYSDEALYAAAVAAKKVNSGKFGVVKWSSLSLK